MKLSLFLHLTGLVLLFFSGIPLFGALKLNFLAVIIISGAETEGNYLPWLNFTAIFLSELVLGNNPAFAILTWALVGLALELIVRIMPQLRAKPVFTISWLIISVILYGFFTEQLSALFLGGNILLSLVIMFMYRHKLTQSNYEFKR